MSDGRNVQLIKNTVILGIGQLIPKLIALISLPLLTDYLSIGDYGIYDTILSIGILALPLLTLLIQQAAFRFIIDNQNDKQEIITNTFVLIFLSSLLVLGIASIIMFFTRISTSLIWAVVFLYMSEVLYDTIGQVSRGLGKNIQYSIGVIIYSLTNFAGLIILVIKACVDLKNILIVSSIAYIISFAFIMCSISLWQFINVQKINKHIIKDMLKYSFPIIPSSISLWIVNLSDRLLITAFLGVDKSGLYAAGNKIPGLCGVAYSVFNLAWTETAARCADDKDRNGYYTRLYEALFSFLMGIFLIVLTLSPLIFKILVDEKFSEGSKQMPILFVAVLLNCLVSFYGGIYIALKRTKQVGYSSALGAVINIIINILLINFVGLYAASISTVLSYFIVFIYRKKEISKYIEIQNKKSTAIIGWSCFVLLAILYYMDSRWMMLVGLFISLTYNIKYNSHFISNLFNKLFGRRKRRIQ